ncbi:MAG: hypothetical protein UT92_C0001G0048 [Candidatus Curtissbacteria bacterium GW2011_GWA1_40_24]|uniref:Type II secretion system protein GspF domain-containing protein n=2 Tax=Patescibacteria group TaxID=1783273 RepID=A0A0G0U8B0_9BACT|nr:MAG: hypothetical protein UT92_C0001G0048 [Candidatus Curtissbacteria bacterium GW2011_GWA1_40_24]KKR89045.1 MAG: hypothetical protein UU38_C0002G0048 [Candidatus Wolfebacteria bacterium GW2011_GWB1_41_12]
MSNFKKFFRQIFQQILWRLSVSDKMLFAKHLSIMIRSGMPLLDSLWLLRRQAKSKTFQKIISGLIVDVDNGQFLSVSLEKYHSVFGDFFINIIRTGEASGTLADNLNYLHEELKKNYALKKKVKAAMIYPVIILGATFGIGGLLIFFVFPKIIPVFSSFKVKLPISTRILIALINFLTNYAVWVFLGLVSFAVLIWILLKIKKIKFVYHRVLLISPFLGKTITNINMTAFSRTLVTLLQSGIKIVDALLITADTMPNLVYQKELKLIAEHTKSGESMSRYLLERENFFPPTFSQMIEVGESTGRLNENLDYLADFYEAEVDEVFRNLSTILEPILLLVMGALVGFIAIAIISPIYEITQSLKIK